MKPLYKTTIIIWTEYDGGVAELENLAFQATEGNAYCSKQESVIIDNPMGDPDWDGTDFFDTGVEW